MTINDLDVLIGSWQLTGRTTDADHDDISGEMTATPLLGGRMLQLVGFMQFGGSRTESLELIWHDDAEDRLVAHVHSGSGPPLDYRWRRDGDVLTHAGFGMTYTGTIGTDAATIAGTWRADPDRPDMVGAEYYAAMRRTG
jgi:hypothetical protein